MLTRVRSVVNTHDIHEEDDIQIEIAFTEAVNDSLRELEDEGCEITNIQFSSHVSDRKVIKSADITYTTEEELELDEEEIELDEEEIEEEVVPTLGRGRNKVTAEVFRYVKDKDYEGLSVEEIGEMFDGNLSSWTINKILRTRSFARYYRS